MPDLRQISCAIEIGPTNIKLPEYLATYQDGKVDVHVPVPDTDLAFSIHITARGYIAPGLAAFVFIDGEYQCNRNQFGFDESLSNDDAQVDFRLRQKEEQTCADKFIGRDWTFQALKFGKSEAGSNSDETGRDKDHFETNVGKVEVVILRCRMSGDCPDAKIKPLGYEPQEHMKEIGDFTYDALQGHMPSGKKREAQWERSKAPSPTAAGSLFGGLSGLFDGATDEPLYYSNVYIPNDRGNAWRNAPYPQNTPDLWPLQHANTAPWPAHHTANDCPPRAPPRNDWSQRVPMPGNEFYPPVAGTYDNFQLDTRGQSDWTLQNPHEVNRGRPMPQQYNDWRPDNMALSGHYHGVDSRQTFQLPMRWDVPSSHFDQTYGCHSTSHAQIDKHEAKVLEQKFRYLQTEKERVRGRVADVKKALDERKPDFSGCESITDMLALRDMLEDQERATVQQLNILTTRLNFAGVNVGALVADSKTNDPRTTKDKQLDSPTKEAKSPSSPTKTSKSHRGDKKKSTISKRESRANSPAKTSSKKSTTSNKRSRASSPTKSTSGDGGWGTTANEGGGWNDPNQPASNSQNWQSNGWDNAEQGNAWDTAGKPSDNKNGQSGGWDDSADKSKDVESKPSDAGTKGASGIAECKKGASHSMKLADSQSYWRDWRRVNRRTSGNAIEALARPVYCAPAEDLPTVHDRVQSQGVTHGVRTGPGAEYCHHIQRPQYIDSMSSPYAVFTFHYRDRATLETLLPKDRLEKLSEVNTQLERQSLQTKPREWLIRQLSLARKSNGATPAKQSTPTAPAAEASRVDGSGKGDKQEANQTNAWNADGWNQEGPADPNVRW